jgi:hypothetical protein
VVAAFISPTLFIFDPHLGQPIFFVFIATGHEVVSEWIIAAPYIDDDGGD